MTDQELSDLVGVSREYVRLLRHGRRNPSPDLVTRIALVTVGQVDASDLTQLKETA